jgi:hypothetical protein
MEKQNIFYREAKVTPDRPGAFLTLWQRPCSSKESNKPIPFKSNQLDYLFVKVQESESENARFGVFIFPAFILSQMKILSTEKVKGKTAFRVFPPWSKDRGNKGTKVFSESAKKTQKWQLPFFVEMH